MLSVLRLTTEAGLNTSIPFTTEDIQRASAVPLAPSTAAKASLQGIRAADWLFRCQVIPALQLLEHPDETQLALKALGGRTASSISSLAALDSIAQINGIASLARVVFELWLDLRAIDRAVYPGGTTKFWAFVRTERLRMARLAIAYDDAHPGVLAPPPDIHRQFVASQAAAIEAETQTLWGQDRPKHWSGTADIRQRAAAVGLEDRYVALYPQLSTYSHGGAAAVEGISLDAFLALAHLSYRITIDAAVDCCQILGLRCGVSARVGGFDAKVEFLSHLVGFVIADYQLMQLGEPLRINLELGPCPELGA